MMSAIWPPSKVSQSVFRVGRFFAQFNDRKTAVDEI
jgi:hypothetical protein